MDIHNADAILEAGMWRAGKTAMGSYLDVLLHANAEIFMEAKNMAVKTRKRKRTFEEVFTEAGLIPEWIARGKKEGRAEGRAEGERKIINLLKSGKSPEEIIREYGS